MTKNTEEAESKLTLKEQTFKELAEHFEPMEQEDTERLSPIEKVIEALYWVWKCQSSPTWHHQRNENGCLGCINTIAGAIADLKVLEASEAKDKPTGIMTSVLRTSEPEPIGTEAKAKSGVLPKPTDALEELRKRVKAMRMRAIREYEHGLRRVVGDGAYNEVLAEIDALSKSGGTQT